MKNLVIDTGALTLFFAGDVRVKPHFDSVEHRKVKGYISSVNLSEFYYKTCQKLGGDTAEIRYHQARSALTAVETDEGLALLAGAEKCRRSTLSLADCFALALAKTFKATLLTTDGELAKVKEVDVKLLNLGPAVSRP